MTNLNCSDLLTSPCCEKHERLWFMRNDPRVKDSTQFIEILSCCLHAHEIGQLPCESRTKYHDPIPKDIKVIRIVSKKLEEKMDFTDYLDL